MNPIILNKINTIPILSSHIDNFINQRNVPYITRTSMSKLVTISQVSELQGRHLIIPKIRDKHMEVQSAMQIRDKCMTVSPAKPYCHTNKRQMYGSESTQALL